jgi:hypothetical protein
MNTYQQDMDITKDWLAINDWHEVYSHELNPFAPYSKSEGWIDPQTKEFVSLEKAVEIQSHRESHAPAE